MNNIMIDIETLSSKPDAAVVAIGAFAFGGGGDNDEPGLGIVSREFEVLLDARLTPGRRDEDTLRWWSEQPADVWIRMTSGTVGPRQACEQLSSFIALHNGKRVWANAPTFDCSILRVLYGVVGLPVPWHFRDERDYRTLLALYRFHSTYDALAVEAIYSERTAHDALSDAVCQARVVQHICAKMGVRL